MRSAAEVTRTEAVSLTATLAATGSEGLSKVVGRKRILKLRDDESAFRSSEII